MDKCIEHKIRRSVIVYQDYLAITEDECAAEVLAAFEFWNNSIQAPADRWLRKTIVEIGDFLFKRHTREVICRALKNLHDKGWLSRRPNTKNPHDQAYEYLFEVEKVQAAIDHWAEAIAESERS